MDFRMAHDDAPLIIPHHYIQVAVYTVLKNGYKWKIVAKPRPIQWPRNEIDALMDYFQIFLIFPQRLQNKSYVAYTASGGVNLHESVSASAHLAHNLWLLQNSTNE